MRVANALNEVIAPRSGRQPPVASDCLGEHYGNICHLSDSLSCPNYLLLDAVSSFLKLALVSKILVKCFSSNTANAVFLYPPVCANVTDLVRTLAILVLGIVSRLGTRPGMGQQSCVQLL